MTYLEKLRARGNAGGAVPTKLTKPGSVSFGSASEAQSALMNDFAAALASGRLVACCNCSGFKAGPSRAEIGHCGRFDAKTWPRVPFACQSYEPKTVPK